MASKWFNSLTTRWRKITGAVAVLLMFFVPITRAVFAGSSGAKNSGTNQGAANNKGTTNNKGASNAGNKAYHSDRSCASDRTPRTPKPVSPVTPKSSKSRSHGSKSGGKYHKPKGK